MSLTQLSILGACVALFGACSTYETETIISPGEVPGVYIAECSIVRQELFPRLKETKIVDSMVRFQSQSGASMLSGITGRKGPEQTSSVTILPNPETDPAKVEVHYRLDKEEGVPGLDRREWVELPKRGHH